MKNVQIKSFLDKEPILIWLGFAHVQILEQLRVHVKYLYRLHQNLNTEVEWSFLEYQEHGQ